ncbi:MAG: hypothetical protein ACX939_01815 [Hyphococcus sp.]
MPSIVTDFALGRFYIADPSLRDNRGHHFSLTSAISRSAELAGLETVWLCSRNRSADLNTGSARLRETFGATMYDNYTLSPAKTRGEHVFDAVLKKLKLKRTRDAGHVNQSLQFKNDLETAIDAEEMGPEDRILIHTADGATYPAIADIFKSRRHNELPLLHIVTPYDPVGVMPNRASPEEVANSIGMLKAANLIDRKIYLYAENEFLAAHLSDLWDTNVRTCALPADAPSLEAIRRAAAYRAESLGISNDSFLIASLGSARVEKGFHLFPDIIRHAFEGLEAHNGAAFVRFVLHASPQIIGRHPTIAETLKTLENEPASRVILLHDALTSTDYENLLLSSDAVMLPYQQNDYRVRSSGIVNEAVAAGKILIATKESFPGNRAVECGGAACVTPADFGRAAAKIAADPAPYRAAATMAQEKYVQKHTSNNYAPLLLATERRKQDQSIVS